MKVLFLGTPDFAVPSLESLVEHGYNIAGVVTQPDRPKGRGKILAPPPVKITAQEHAIPVFQPERIKTEDSIANLRALEPDLAVTAAYGQILPPEFLSIPRLGTINVHASLLPKHRGGAPIHRAIMEGDKETGVTIMKVVRELDAGAIISQVRVPITEHDTTGTLHDKLATAGAKLLVETIPRWLSGEIKEVEQNHEEATFSPNIRREDELVDWNRTALQIYDHIRGLSPWPGAYTMLGDRIVKLWKARYSPENSEPAPPGTVIQADDAGIVVTAHRGVVILDELQVEGKRKMASGDLSRGNTITAGMMFH